MNYKDLVSTENTRSLIPLTASRSTQTLDELSAQEEPGSNYSPSDSLSQLGSFSKSDWADMRLPFNKLVQQMTTQELLSRMEALAEPSAFSAVRENKPCTRQSLYHSLNKTLLELQIGFTPRGRRTVGYLDRFSINLKTLFNQIGVNAFTLKGSAAHHLNDLTPDRDVDVAVPMPKLDYKTMRARMIRLLMQYTHAKQLQVALKKDPHRNDRHWETLDNGRLEHSVFRAFIRDEKIHPGWFKWRINVDAHSSPIDIVFYDHLAAPFDVLTASMRIDVSLKNRLAEEQRLIDKPAEDWMNRTGFAWFHEDMEGALARVGKFLVKNPDAKWLQPNIIGKLYQHATGEERVEFIKRLLNEAVPKTAQIEHIRTQCWQNILLHLIEGTSVEDTSVEGTSEEGASGTRLNRTILDAFNVWLKTQAPNEAWRTITKQGLSDKEAMRFYSGNLSSALTIFWDAREAFTDLLISEQTLLPSAEEIDGCWPRPSLERLLEAWSDPDAHTHKSIGLLLLPLTMYHLQNHVQYHDENGEDALRAVRVDRLKSHLYRLAGNVVDEFETIDRSMESLRTIKFDTYDKQGAQALKALQRQFIHRGMQLLRLQHANKSAPSGLLLNDSSQDKTNNRPETRPLVDTPKHYTLVERVLAWPLKSKTVEQIRKLYHEDREGLRYDIGPRTWALLRFDEMESAAYEIERLETQEIEAHNTLGRYEALETLCTLSEEYDRYTCVPYFSKFMDVADVPAPDWGTGEHQKGLRLVVHFPRSAAPSVYYHDALGLFVGNVKNALPQGEGLLWNQQLLLIKGNFSEGRLQDNRSTIRFPDAQGQFVGGVAEGRLSGRGVMKQVLGKLPHWMHGIFNDTLMDALRWEGQQMFLQAQRNQTTDRLQKAIDRVSRHSARSDRKSTAPTSFSVENDKLACVLRQEAGENYLSSDTQVMISGTYSGIISDDWIADPTSALAQGQLTLRSPLSELLSIQFLNHWPLLLTVKCYRGENSVELTIPFKRPTELVSIYPELDLAKAEVDDRENGILIKAPYDPEKKMLYGAGTLRRGGMIYYGGIKDLLPHGRGQMITPGGISRIMEMVNGEMYDADLMDYKKNRATSATVSGQLFTGQLVEEAKILPFNIPDEYFSGYFSILNVSGQKAFGRVSDGLSTGQIHNIKLDTATTAILKTQSWVDYSGEFGYQSASTFTTSGAMNKRHQTPFQLKFESVPGSPALFFPHGIGKVYDANFKREKKRKALERSMLQPHEPNSKLSKEEKLDAKSGQDGKGDIESKELFWFMGVPISHSWQTLSDGSSHTSIGVTHYVVRWNGKAGNSYEGEGRWVPTTEQGFIFIPHGLGTLYQNEKFFKGNFVDGKQEGEFSVGGRVGAVQNVMYKQGREQHSNIGGDSVSNRNSPGTRPLSHVKSNKIQSTRTSEVTQRKSHVSGKKARGRKKKNRSG